MGRCGIRLNVIGNTRLPGMQTEHPWHCKGLEFDPRTFNDNNPRSPDLGLLLYFWLRPANRSCSGGLRSVNHAVRRARIETTAKAMPMVTSAMAMPTICIVLLPVAGKPVASDARQAR